MTARERNRMNRLEQYRNHLRGKDPDEVMRWALEEFGWENIALATSFSIEDQVLTHMLAEANREARIFTLDTGRLHQETYDVMQRTMEKYGVRFEVCFPEPEDISKMVSENGPNLFYESVDRRKRCCEVRKLDPLGKALLTVDAWVCGLRRGQSVTRTEVELIEWDSSFMIYKLNPLSDWSEEDAWQFIRQHGIPYNALYDSGFRSIGCAPCTRAVGEGDDIRAGRWWWESPEHKECGLHRSPQQR
ncbi:MAG: phosphoadenylyl-sulfate reductase, partial [Candidatus Latescibacterota bacterium]